MYSRMLILFFTLLILPVSICAEEEYTVRSVFSDYLNVPQDQGFLRIPGLDFHSSIGFSYFSSNHYSSQGMGYYMGHFKYRLSSSWTLRWDVGIQSSLVGPDAGDQAQLYLPSIDLIYRPNKSMMLSFQFRQYRYYQPYMSRRFW